MIRIRSVFCFLPAFLAVAVLFSSRSSVVPARAEIHVSTIEAGYDLYQLEFGGGFLGIEIEGVPLETFDFGDGNGAVSVGTADTIVRRLSSVDNFDEEDGPEGDFVDFASVDIEIVALTLRSINPVDIPDVGSDILYFGLDSSSPSTGSYGINFFDDLRSIRDSDIIIPGDGGGGYMPSVNVNYEIRFGSPTGPVVDLNGVEPNSVSLESEASSGWSRFPSDDAPDRVIPGVNSFLNGSNQNDDFFLLGFDAMILEGGTNTGPVGLTGFAYTMADAEAGDQADVPILPDGGGDDGEPFFFQDVNVPEGGAWFDPPMVSAYAYETTDGLSEFLSVGLPTFATVPDADMSYIITSADGTATVASGAVHAFGSPVSEFTISGIDPTVDGGDPLAFPVFLQFNQLNVSLTITPVPEPNTIMLALVMSSLGFGFTRRR